MLRQCTTTISVTLLLLIPAGMASGSDGPVDDFENGVIAASQWVWDGLNRATSGGQGGNWQWSHVESNGYLEMRVWGPTSANTFGGEAWIRTLYDYNDDQHHVINFMWEAEVQESHYNHYHIQVTDGYISPDGNPHWPFGEAPIPGTTDLLWRSDPTEYPGAHFPSGFPQSTWSITIDPAGVARLYDGPNASGSLVREEQLDPAFPWHLRFMVIDATSAGFPAGDISFNLYDLVSSLDCNTNGIPDEDELDGNDCNTNGVPDTCELVDNDCNSNGVPDECDLIAPWVPIYSTDFAADPNWITNNATNYSWQAVDGTYFINQFNINYGGEYAYHDTGYSGGSFKLKWDILMERNDYASGVNVGIYDTDLDSHTTGSYVHVYFSRIDQGYIAHLGAADANDVTYYDTDYAMQYAFDTWYRVVLTYDAINTTVTAEVRERSTATLLTALSFNDVGPFSTDMTRIGSSNVRANTTFQVPGADSTGRLDNMVLLVPSTDCNGNDLPDECELDGNDCNTNGIPDGCEADFDGDGLIDDCDPDIDDDGVLNEVDNCDFTPTSLPAHLIEPDGSILGDLDGDCDVDLVDYAIMQERFTGPN
jgi:hypothetical protein